MKITGLDIVRIGVNHRGCWLLVRLETDEGLTGIGEASHGGEGPARDDVVISILRHQCLPVLRGRDPREVVAITTALQGIVRGFATATAVSACEQALWDLASKAAGLPLHQMLGGPARDRIPLYANVNRATVDRSPGGFATSAAAAVNEGFRTVKCAPFDGVDRQRNREPAQRALIRQGLDRIAAIRDAVGNDIDVQVDCHSRFDVPTSIEVAQELRNLGVTWFEEPLLSSDIEGLQRLRPHVVDLELVGGELIYGVSGFWPFFADKTWDVIMPDIKHCGGVSALRAISEVATSRGVAVSPHNPSGPVAMIASAQTAAAMPVLRSLEYAWGEVPWRSTLLDPPEQIVDGHLVLPAQPGLGVTLNEATVEQHLVHEGHGA